MKLRHLLLQAFPERWRNILRLFDECTQHPFGSRLKMVPPWCTNGYESPVLLVLFDVFQFERDFQQDLERHRRLRERDQARLRERDQAEAST